MNYYIKSINKLILSLVTGIFVFTSCTEPMDIELDSVATRLVVEGDITTDTMVHWVRLSLTSDYFYNNLAPAVSNAQVSISDGTNTLQLTEDPQRAGYYLTDATFYGIPGKTYTLNINNVDVDNNGVSETYTATSLMPDVKQPDSIKVVKLQMFNTDAWTVLLFVGQDPPLEENYYMMKCRLNGIQKADTLTEVQITDDVLFNGQPVVNNIVYVLTSFKPDEAVKSGDTITLEMSGIPRDYFKFINELKAVTQGSNPIFGSAMADVRTNVVCTVGNVKTVGFFTTYATKRVSVIYQDPPQAGVQP